MNDVYVASLDLSAGIVTEPPAPVSQRFVGANSAADWSPDGSEIAYMSLRVAFTSGERTNEVWVLENLLPGAK